MRNPENWLTVCGNKGQEYVQKKYIICMRADSGCCEIYHYNYHKNRVERAVGNDSLKSYGEQTAKYLWSLGRKAWVNPKYVSKIKKGLIEFNIDWDEKPTLSIPRALVAKVKSWFQDGRSEG